MCFSGVAQADNGENGAKIGTAIYNTMNPTRPLPMPQSDNHVFKQTLQNLGAGQKLGPAWQNAAQSAAGVKNGSVK